jgi:hypothetical protein
MKLQRPWHLIVRFKLSFAEWKKRQGLRPSIGRKASPGRWEMAISSWRHGKVINNRLALDKTSTLPAKNSVLLNRIVYSFKTKEAAKNAASRIRELPHKFAISIESA